VAFANTLRALKELDLADLNFENLGSWPLIIKLFVGVLLFTLHIAAGYHLHIEALQLRLENIRAEEIALRRDFEQKALEASTLEAYKRQMVEIEESFGALVSQLPSKTEVPRLLEYITNKGASIGLAIKTIDLLEELPQEFYVELPIQINAVGSFHDLGAFISGMAGLPQIVTLHDFNIVPLIAETNQLEMNILAKTYRYRVGDDDS
jgi:type IV pilus assembly protein PilO